jgi:hypothetical protein
MKQMPRHDIPTGPSKRHGLTLSQLRTIKIVIATRLGPNRRKDKKRGRKDEGGVPVDPNRPHTLSGGAAAALEFDD